MTATTIFLDVGDVLVRTHPNAQYAAMADLLGGTAQSVAEAAEPLVDRLEAGVLDFEAFADEVARRLEVSPVSRREMEAAWCAVIGEVDAQVAGPAADLARAGRIVLASNTSVAHWRLVRTRLAAFGLGAPMFASFDAGMRKPADAYFDALLRRWRPPPGSIFVDDRIENVAAAERHGLVGHQHTDPDETASLLIQLVTSR